jgi:glutamate transport system permease protein
LEDGAMSSVLFDNPGPRTRSRHRLYSLIAGLAMLGIVGLVLWRLGRTGQLEYDLWEVFVTPAYIQALLVDGLLRTLQMAFSSIILAVAFGMVFGLGKLSDHGWVRWPSWVIVEFFRAVPVLLMMIFIFFTYGAGEGGIGSYWSVVIALTLYNGSVLAEVFRAGVLAVPKGQSEAAYAVGMRKSQVMTSVLLPQAVKIMLPAIISQCVVALKDTTLGYIILAPGLTEVGKAIFLQFQNHLQTAIVLAAMFIAVNLLLSWVATWVQHKLVGEKKPLEISMVGGQAGDSQALLP